MKLHKFGLKADLPGRHCLLACSLSLGFTNIDNAPSLAEVIYYAMRALSSSFRDAISRELGY